jgi:hypothetical protein
MYLLNPDIDIKNTQRFDINYDGQIDALDLAQMKKCILEL